MAEGARGSSPTKTGQILAKKRRPRENLLVFDLNLSPVMEWAPFS